MTPSLYYDRWTSELNDQVVFAALDDCELVADEELQMLAEKYLDDMAYMFEANPDQHHLSVFEFAEQLSSALAINALGWTIEERFERAGRWCPGMEMVADCHSLSRVVTYALEQTLKDLAERLAVHMLTTMQGAKLIESIDWDAELA